MKTLVLSVVFAVTSIVNAVNNNSLEGFAYNTRMDGRSCRNQKRIQSERG